MKVEDLIVGHEYVHPRGHRLTYQFESDDCLFAFCLGDDVSCYVALGEAEAEELKDIDELNELERELLRI